ncbi:hypothetical protein GCM10018775_30840 [Streptomyces umbrinus]|nr:hypothetical protein GCM10018775_30840 [Streptomyces umbrinus]
MQGPFLVEGRVLGPRVYAYLPTPLRIGGARHHLHRHPTPLGQDQRRVQRELLHHRAAHLVARPDGQFDEAGAGEQHSAHHRVIGQPRLPLDRQTARQDHTTRPGQLHHRTQQRVFGAHQTRSTHLTPHLGRTRPVVLVLEGVGRQVDRVGEPAFEEGGPGDGYASGVQVAQGPQKMGRLGPVPTQSRNRVPGLIAVCGKGREGGQGRVGADLQERTNSRIAQRLHAVAEPDRLTYMPYPVLRRAQVLRVREGAGEVGDQRDDRRVERDLLGDLAEGSQHRLHQRRVKGVRDPQPPRALEAGRSPHHVTLLAGDHDSVGAVDRRDRHPLLTEILVRQDGDDLVLGGPHRDHGTPGRQRTHQPTTCCYQRTRIRQREHPGQMRCGQFTDGVPGDIVRPHTPRLQQPPQRHLQRKQRRLRKLRTIQTTVAISLFNGPHDLPQGQAQLPDHLIQHTGKHRERLVQLPPHTQPLTALPGTDERQPTTNRHPTQPLTPGHRLQLSHQLGSIRTNHHHPVPQCRTRCSQRIPDIHHIQIPLAHMGGKTRRLLPQRLPRTSRQHPRHHRQSRARPLGLLRTLRALRLRSLFEDQVGVGAAEPERGDARPAGMAVGLPGLGLGEQFDRTCRPVDMW